MSISCRSHQLDIRLWQSNFVHYWTILLNLGLLHFDRLSFTRWTRFSWVMCVAWSNQAIYSSFQNFVYFNFFIHSFWCVLLSRKLSTSHIPNTLPIFILKRNTMPLMVGAVVLVGLLRQINQDFRLFNSSLVVETRLVAAIAKPRNNFNSFVRSLCSFVFTPFSSIVVNQRNRQLVRRRLRRIRHFYRHWLLSGLWLFSIISVLIKQLQGVLILDTLLLYTLVYHDNVLYIEFELEIGSPDSSLVSALVHALVELGTGWRPDVVAVVSLDWWVATDTAVTFLNILNDTGHVNTCR